MTYVFSFFCTVPVRKVSDTVKFIIFSRHQAAKGGGKLRGR